MQFGPTASGNNRAVPSRARRRLLLLLLDEPVSAGDGELTWFNLRTSVLLCPSAHEGPVFSLLSTDCRLLSAGNGEVSAWSWSELIKKNVKPLWTKRPNYKSSLEIPEINSMIINPRDNSLVVGGGDNNIHILDLEHGVFKSVLQGHSDYVHCVSVREREAEILSGGEDGAVRIWDSRTGQTVHCIEVYKYEECARPQFGKWISCLTTDSDWMLLIKTVEWLKQ
ncbi:THO complex subunit 6 homolog [Seriola lalandi dorsalis]|uniref:THO complex subunit 6 homolog n=1 Tax=Seriola lalandi dorsalis TaxID=1841481 RepID=UPI000C6FA37D|nr:THO complex subunit 6 homolog [Seriola lalandi dorsalis]